jgi:hypothetical protein
MHGVECGWDQRRRQLELNAMALTCMASNADGISGAGSWN